MTPSSASRPIFVLGSMRSGTTLLRLMLDSHPDVAIGVETGFMRGFDSVKDIPGFRYGQRWYERIGVTEAEIDQRLATFFSGVFVDGARRQGASRWGDKTPFHVWHAETMARAFPGAQFIALVRHPVAVARSLQRWRYSEEDALEHWASITAELVHIGRELRDRLCLFRFEDLVIKPAEVMPDLLTFLNLTSSDAVLRHHDRRMPVDGLVEGGTNPREPIDRARALDRLSDAPESLRAAASRAAGELACVFGYLMEPPFFTEVGDGPGWDGPLLAGSRLDELFEGQLPARPARPRPTLPAGAELRDLVNELDDLRNRRSVRAARAVRSVLRARSMRDLVTAIRSLGSSLRKQSPPRRLHLS